MTNIRPFKAVVYNTQKIPDLAAVVCPPYDVISKEEQDFYYRQSPYNFIRLVLNKPDSQDDNSHNKYSRSGLFFNAWLNTGILKQDEQDSIYIYKQDYFCGDKEFVRIGFIALLQIDEAIVFPHENTHTAAKTDRFELMKTVKANLSPIFTVFSDKHKKIESICTNFIKNNRPTLALKDALGVRNSLWRVSRPQVISQIARNMSDKHIFIADGHHRYEVAYNYCKFRREKDKDYSLDKSYNYVMTYFTALESEGLCVMPVHRVLKSGIGASVLAEYFRLEKLNSLLELEQKLESCSKKDAVYGFYCQNEFLLLELKDKNKACNFLGGKKCFLNLDVAILDFYLLNHQLKISKSEIIYTKDISQAQELVDRQKAAAAFILRPTSVSQICQVALAGEKMPPKSTYFYPKLLCGLTVHKFDNS